MRRTGLAIVLAALLVIAGCSAPTPSRSATTGTAVDSQSTEPETTTTDGDASSTNTSEAGDGTDNTESADQVSDIEVQNGTLPLDATALYGQVRELLDEDSPPPLVIEVRSHESMTSPTRSLPRFAQIMGISSGTRSEETAAAGITRDSGYVGLNARLLDHEERMRDVLVHEFVHVVQFNQGYIETARENADTEGTDGRMTELAVIEGAPVFVEAEYLKTYSDTGPEDANGLGPAYRNSSGVRKYALAPYYFGWRYYTMQAGNASTIVEVYKDPPNTTETVIHGYDPGTEPPRALDANVSETNWEWRGRDRLGELFVRHVLVTELDTERAAAAAAGWGADEQLKFQNNTETAYVWALRWDTVEDADEYEAATEDYLDARGERQGDRWTVQDSSFRVVRTSPETVVLVIGPQDFVTETTVSGTNQTVEITA